MEQQRSYTHKLCEPGRLAEVIHKLLITLPGRGVVQYEITSPAPQHLCRVKLRYKMGHVAYILYLDVPADLKARVQAYWDGIRGTAHRNALVHSLAALGLAQGDVAQLLSLTQGRVSSILNPRLPKPHMW